MLLISIGLKRRKIKQVEEKLAMLRSMVMVRKFLRNQ